MQFVKQYFILKWTQRFFQTAYTTDRLTVSFVGAFMRDSPTARASPASDYGKL
jgi:hypothetical protein